MVNRLIYLLGMLLAVPVGGHAEVAETYEIESGRSTGVASNIAIDIISHGLDSTGVWMATGRGVNYTYDAGASWFVYNTAHGLPAENLSAIFSIDGRIWIGSNHNELIQGQLMTLSDGLSFSDDDGENWVTLDFSPDGLNIPFVEGGDRTIFDITGHADRDFFNHRLSNSDADWMFVAAFAGGLLASQDGGLNWRRIFPSPLDSIQYSLPNQPPSLRNRYFSCAADTSHGDSLFLWAGTAAGIFQYVYAPPRSKLYSRRINRIEFCDTCSSGGGTRLFIGGEQGMSLGSAAGGNLATRFEIDGLPGAEVTAVHSIGDKLLAGTIDPATDASSGLAISGDNGEFYTQVNLPAVVGANRTISDFAAMNGRVYMAAQSAGLFVSADSGQNWQAVPVDTLFAPAPLNVVNSMNVLEDTLLIGTDSGLVELALDVNGDILAGSHQPFLDTDSTSARIIRIRPQFFENDTLAGTYDSTVLWTIHRPVSGAGGIPMVGRRSPSGLWNYYRRGVVVHDINFFGDTVFAVGERGIWFSPRGEEMTNFFSARQFIDDTLVIARLDSDTVSVMEVRQDTVVFGTHNGIAISHDRGGAFTIYRANNDTLAADLVINHSYLGTVGGLIGDFIPAIDVQYLSQGPARIWAGARPANFGEQGISVAEFDSATGSLSWQPVYEDNFAWNLAFMGDTILAATSDGLIMNDGTLDSLNSVWETVALTDQNSGEILVPSGTAAFGIAVVDPFVWVGTDDGTVRLDRGDLGNQTLYMRVDSTTAADEVYAFPVPFSPNRGQTVDFHFRVEQAGAVTLEIYDFAMNLVARPIDNVHYAAGIYPTQSSQGASWDGLNDQNDVVAVGVYYFRVEYESGESRWGKLAVIP